MTCRSAFVGFALALTTAGLGGAAPAAERPLNVVLVLADDLGWTGLSCFGSDFYETPHLDRLAREGMRFTQNYSACTVCSPTRAALLTGKYPARLHITDWIPGMMPANPKLLVPNWTKYLPREEKTIADAFRAAGYGTASIGKWHLGGPEYYPEHHGFDVNVAGTKSAGMADYFAPWKTPTISEGRPGEYITERLGEEAVKFIERVKDRPFFLYLPHFAVHNSGGMRWQGPPDLEKKYRRKLRPGLTHDYPAYAAMVESMDATVGRIRAKLEELKLADRTIIVFTSDNGGMLPATSNKPLRYGKASAYEGGVRVPLIVYWPGVTRPGSVSDTPTITMDLHATLLEMCSLAKAPVSDGVSLVPLLRRSGEVKREAIYWHYPHHQWYQIGGANPYGAIRAGDFKLIEFYDDHASGVVQRARRHWRRSRFGGYDAGEGQGASHPAARVARGGGGPDAYAEPQLRSVQARSQAQASAEKVSAAAAPPQPRERLLSRALLVEQGRATHSPFPARRKPGTVPWSTRHP